MKLDLFILSAVILCSGCTSTIHLQDPTDSRIKDVSSLGRSRIASEYPEAYHAALLESFHAAQCTQTVQLTNTMQYRWPNHSFLASAYYYSGYSILILNQPEMWNAKKSATHWASYIDHLIIAALTFRQASQTDSSGSWNARCNNPIQLITQGFYNNEAMANYIYIKFQTKIIYYQTPNGDQAALQKAISEYGNLSQNHPDWMLKFPFITKENDETKLATSITNGRKQEADILFGREL